MHAPPARPLAAAVTVPLSLCLLAGLATLVVAPATARADDVRFETNEPGLELWNRTSQVAMVPVRVGRYGTAMERSYVYAQLCASTPCTADLALGTHVLGLSRPGESVVESQTQLNIGGPATVTASYHDRSVLRALGYLTMLVGPAAGVGLLFAAQEPATAPGDAGSSNSALVGLGIGVGIGGLIAGLAMVFTRDSTTFTVTPLIGSLGGAKREVGGGGGGMPRAAMPTLAMNGLALGIRF